MSQSTSLLKLSRRRPVPYLDILTGVVEGVALAAFIAMMVCTLLQVFARYLHFALDWTEELARILFLGAVMIGMAVAIRHREHIVVDFVFARLSARAQAAASVVFDIAILVLLVVWLRGALWLLQLNLGTTFVTLPWLPVSWLYAVEAFGIALMILFVGADLVRHASALKPGKAAS